MTIWQKQWQEFAENFHDGYAHIHLKKYGSSKDLLIKLLPGGGFGDLSHPTTQLMLELLIPHVEGKTVVDIGTGSGILALASAKLGAKKVVGIDICPEALEHAEQNAKVNQLSISFSNTLPSLPANSLFLMNMIYPEQKIVMKQEFCSPPQWITSGILEEQEEIYLQQAELWGWSLIEMKKKDGWLGFRFQKK